MLSTARRQNEQLRLKICHIIITVRQYLWLKYDLDIEFKAQGRELGAQSR